MRISDWSSDVGSSDLWRGRAATDDDRRSWGYMPQERGLYRDMRVIDQLTWLARLHGLVKVTGEARARTLLAQRGLRDRAADQIHKLPGGLAQRVQLAAAMVHEPDLPVLHDPFPVPTPLAAAF